VGFCLRVKSVFRTLAHKEQVEDELDSEIRGYVNALAEEKIEGGMSAAEARRQALAECGGLEHVKQAVRDHRTSTALESLAQDVRYGLRQLKRNPAFTWTAVLTLGLAIGATTAIFSAVYGLLLRSLPYRDANRLMHLSNAWPKKNAYNGPLILPDFVAAQSGLKSFESIAAFVNRGDGNLTGTGDPVRVKVVGVTASFLTMLGVVPQPGRNFLSSEDRFGVPSVVLLSHRLWKNKFQGEQSIIGRSIVLEGKTLTVVGVLPTGFIFPDPAVEPDIYVPAQFDPDTNLSPQKQILAVDGSARLRDGVSIQQAQAELLAFAEARAKNYPAMFGSFADGRQILVEPLQRYLTGDDRKPLFILLASVVAVLLIACANVANLQLARAASRRHETALRGALGARRLRLLRQFLVESLMLATLASSLGVVIALAVTWLVRQGGMPADSAETSLLAELIRMPFGKLSAAVNVDGAVLAFTAGLALLTTIFFGLAPAITGSGTDLRTSLQGTALRSSSGREQRLLRHMLLIMEVGLAVVLLSASGLLIRSFSNVLRNDSGFDPGHCLTGVVQHNYDEPAESVTRFVHQLLPRLLALPGAQAAAIASALPLDGMLCPNTALTFGEGSVPPPATWQHGCAVSITPDYFRAAGTLVLKGRAFSDDDNATSAPVAIVNQAFARRYFAGAALGRRLNTTIQSKQPGTDFTHTTIVGVVQDVRYNGLEQDAQPVIYLPIDQLPHWTLNILLRTAVEPGSLAAAMRKTIVAIDAEHPMFDVQTMENRVSHTVAQRRLIMLLIASFAMLAVVLSGVGVYGVFAYSVSQRTQEMGIRLALGASRGRLLRLVVSQALRLILVGGFAGIAVAWFVSRLLTSMLVGVKPHDPISFASAWILMTFIALLGSTFPARNAARTDLIFVLHSE
jgi:predicted permease